MASPKPFLKVLSGGGGEKRSAGNEVIIQHPGMDWKELCRDANCLARIESNGGVLCGDLRTRQRVTGSVSTEQ